MKRVNRGPEAGRQYRATCGKLGSVELGFGRTETGDGRARSGSRECPKIYQNSSQAIYSIKYIKNLDALSPAPADPPQIASSSFPPAPPIHPCHVWYQRHVYAHSLTCGGAGAASSCEPRVNGAPLVCLTCGEGCPCAFAFEYPVFIITIHL